MFYLIYLAIRLFIWFLYLTLMLVLSLPIILVSAVAFLAQNIQVYLVACGQAMGALDGGSPRPVILAPNQPAYPQYLYGPAGGDLRHAAKAVLPRMMHKQRLYGAWIKDTFFEYGKSAYLWVPGVFVAVGLGLGWVLAAAVLSLVALMQLTFWAALFLGGLGTLFLLRVIDTVLLRVRRIHPSCSSCHEPFTYPMYACPNATCTVRHKDVRPGRYGLTHRRCRCGTTMPTLLMLGSHRLTAFCPLCQAPLSRKVGTESEIVLPLLGAAGAGKTRLALAIAMELKEMNRRNGLGAEPADDYTRREYDQMTRALRLDEPTRPTVMTALRAYSYDVVSVKGGKRLLHVYDAPGERMNSSDRLQEMRYMKLARTFIFAVDPLSIDDMWRSLTPARQTQLQGLRSQASPQFVFAQVLENIQAMNIPTRKTSLAVVVTKHDLIRDEAIVAGFGDTSDHIEGWLRDRAGLDNTVRAMKLAFGQVRFFWSSATVHDGGVDPTVAPVITWAMKRSGLSAG